MGTSHVSVVFETPGRAFYTARLASSHYDAPRTETDHGTSDMGLGNFLKKLGVSIEVNVVVEDYEADLYAPDEGRPGGKLAELEYAHFKSGESKFEIEIKRRAG
ncbi:MAG: hypothetical protein KTR15_06480, partial [Phycisphaeraceae bacterium]|nr:hypothetical protein [Phycisphaeraceae bacterium]